MFDEILDLVDKNDTVVATMPRSEVFSKKLKNFRVVCALLKNSSGKLFIPRRALHKADYAGYLACVGGCVQSGESYENALRRETLEEVMIDVNEKSYRFLGFISPFEHTVNGHVAAYEVIVDNDVVTYAEQDFCEGSWLYPSQIKELIAQGEKVTINLSALLELYYL